MLYFTSSKSSTAKSFLCGGPRARQSDNLETPARLVIRRCALSRVHALVIGINLGVPRVSKIVMRNVFEAQTLGLAQEKEGTHGNHRIKEPPKKEGSPTHIGDHVGGRDGEDKVEQPLRADPDRDTWLSDPCRKDLRDVRPGKRAPGQIVRDDEQVDECDCCDATRSYSRVPAFRRGVVRDDSGTCDLT